MRTLAALILTVAAVRLMALDLYVATNGNDANAGTAGAPFATVGRARDAIRTIKSSSGLPAGGVTVWLRGGYYNLTNSVVFDSRDSGSNGQPVVYAAYPGEEPHITGARPLDPLWFTLVTATNAVWSRLDAAARGQVYEANLKSHGLTNYGALKNYGFGNGAIAPLELFCNGRPMTLARWPNAQENLALTGAVITNTQFTYSGARPERWREAAEIWMQGLWYQTWADSAVKVAAIDTTNKVVTLASAPAYGIAPHRQYFAFNILEELDQPGEYYLDRTSGILYFWPPGSLGTADLEASVLEVELLQLTGCQHLTFRNLVLEAGRAGLVRFSSGELNLVEGCLLRNAGQGGATIAGTNNGLSQCEIVDCGERGASLSGGSRAALTPGGNYVANSRIHRVSRRGWTYLPAINLSGCGNRAVNNLLDELPHSAILFSGNNHLICSNEIRRVCLLTSDAGAIYTGRDWGYRGNVLDNNFIHHIQTLQADHGVNAVYLDDCVSGPAVVNNIIYRVDQGGIFCGGGRDLIMTNNVLAACGMGHFSGDYGRSHITNTPGSSWNLLERLASDGIQYQAEPWATAYPACAAIPNSFDAILQGLWRNPEGCVFARNAGWSNSMWMQESTNSKTAIFSAYALITNNVATQPALFNEWSTLDRSRRPATLSAGVTGFRPVPFSSIGRDLSGLGSPTTAPPIPRLTVKTETGPASSRLGLSWSDDGNLARNQESAFLLQRRNEPDGSWTVIESFGPDTDCWWLYDLAPATTYAFRVVASNAVGVAVSTAATVTTPTNYAAGTVTHIEAESGYSVVADVGSYGTVGISNGQLDSDRSVRMFDTGDAISLRFTNQTAGLYQIRARMRNGSYVFTLDGQSIDLTMDAASQSAADSAYGGAVWGTFYGTMLTLAAGTHTLQIEALSTWQIADYIEVVTYAPLVVDTYGEWQAARFSLDQRADASVSGRLASPARDRIPNLMKYALGLDPWTAYAGDSFKVELRSGHLRATYARPAGLIDVSYEIQVSADLKAWAALTPVVAGRTNGIETVEAVDPDGPGNAPQRFMRLKVTGQ